MSGRAWEVYTLLLKGCTWVGVRYRTGLSDASLRAVIREVGAYLRHRQNQRSRTTNDLRVSPRRSRVKT